MNLSLREISHFLWTKRQVQANMQFTQMASRDTTEDEVPVNENNPGLKESQEPWSGGETESEEEEEVEEQQEELEGCHEMRFTN